MPRAATSDSNQNAWHPSESSLGVGKLTSTAHEGALFRHELVHANSGTRRDRGCVCRGSVGIAMLIGRAATTIEDGSLRMRH